ncbi:hypothetical protein Sste5346_000064 [Sporothrix stenoceras]|uniref:ADP-ribosylation factor n=1 Tax=Sporothrix stenoceras TaxID=5173 RepID=A0ABR3ZRY1_9PEZI
MVCYECRSRLLSGPALRAFPSLDHLRGYSHNRSIPNRRQTIHAVREAFSASAKNFVIEFGDDAAHVAYNLTEDHIKELLDLENNVRLPSHPVRWINIWNPSDQKGIVEAIGSRYHFSKRLTMSIWAWDRVKKKILDEKQAARKQQKNDLRQNSHHLHHHHSPSGTGLRYRFWSKIRPKSPALARSIADPEDGIVVDPIASKIPGVAGGGQFDGSHGSMPVDDGPDGQQQAAPIDAMIKNNIPAFRIMQESLHYTTIDQEQHFVCIGANWLHQRLKGQTQPNMSLVPPKHWSWFVVCDDHTIISFHEEAYYEKAPKSVDKQKWEEEELGHMRSNTLKVFRQLSKVGIKEDQHKFSQLTSVRQTGGGRRLGDNKAQSVDVTSNLFYYLFEDYTAAFDILNSSKAVLDEISGVILGTAVWKNREDTSNVVPRLYKLNKEMRQLQHLFSNYKTLIDRLLSSNANGFDVTGSSFYFNDERDINSLNANSDSRLLSTKAVNRFKRLQIQLQSLMLDAIKDCLDEKESLQSTYFHLITQKDSHSTERLTRSATLLAKLSVFFLPISFMTSYFSIQIPDLIDGYTAWTYWGAFAVIASVSFLSLFFFSKVLMFLSERLDHWADGATQWTSERAGLKKRKALRAMEAEEDS